jgi:GntP family gluconate:H+ symporter
VLIQILMVGLIIAFPNIVSGGLATKEKVDIRNIRIEVPTDTATPGGGDTSGGINSEQDDATKALEKEMGSGGSTDKAAEPAPAPAPEPKK